MVGAPVGIALIAGISVPAVLIGENSSHKKQEEWFKLCIGSNAGVNGERIIVCIIYDFS